MPIFSRHITDLIRSRFSCRRYTKDPMEAITRQKLIETLASLKHGPLGSLARFQLLDAGDQDNAALRGLGTYGFIKGESAFIVGAVQSTDQNLEDYGYLMELAVLQATDLGLGTCWLGGTFTHSHFAQKIALQSDETLPAVVSLGYSSDQWDPIDDLVRLSVKSRSRLPWNKLFFESGFDQPLSNERKGPPDGQSSVSWAAYLEALEMVRLGPSASNKQPWRIVHTPGKWHFFRQSVPVSDIQRKLTSHWVHANLQRVDTGIAMCHFELTIHQKGLSGSWQTCSPGILLPDTFTNYVISWVE